MNKTWWMLTAASTAGYAAVLHLSHRFDYNSPTQERPLLAFYGLMGLLFVLYLLAMTVASRTRSLLWPVLGAVVFRVLLVFSTPIQEVDIYRYLWDGAVLAAGENPFRHPPSQVSAAVLDGVHPHGPQGAFHESFQRLVELPKSRPGVHDALLRIHYPALTTVYPPVSQAVFAVAATTTPNAASLTTRVRVMKVWLVAFDLATLGLVIALLRSVGLPPAMCVAYGWCPLLLKEIANSGHLDAIAVFLVALACWLQTQRTLAGRLGAAVALALGVGAKLFPVVLLPWMLVWTWQHRRSWALLQVVAFLGVTFAVMAPMLLTQRASVTPARAPANAMPDADAPALPIAPSLAPTADAAPSGLAVFLKHWEMNDFLFLLVFENLRTTEGLPPTRQAWFSILPESWRLPLTQYIAERLGVDQVRAAFLLTRALTAGAFLAIAVWLMCGAYRRTSVESQQSDSNLQWLRTAFLLLAWFLLLCPTINPWYWTWTLPLLAMAKSPAWRLASGLLMTYYLRFYCDYQLGNQPVAGTSYVGIHFFDYVLIWAEHLPLFAALIWCQYKPTAQAPE